MPRPPLPARAPGGQGAKGRWDRGDRIALFLLLLLPLLFFPRVYLGWLDGGGGSFLLRDLFADFLPWRLFAREALTQGTLPLWNPYSSSGQPFLAEPQSAIFYPPNLLFYLLPPLFALKGFIYLHLLLAGGFMYRLMRHWGMAPPAALLAALVFMFNGHLLSRMEFLSVLSTIIWLPLVFYLLDRGLAAPTLGGAAPLALVLALQFLAGNPQEWLYGLLAAALYWAVQLFRRPRGGRILPLLSFPLAVVIALLLVMVQLLPTYELTGQSIRSGGFDPRLEQASLHPIHLLTLLVPRLFGAPGYDRYWGITLLEFWLGSFYLGLLPLLLIPLALMGRQRLPRLQLTFFVGLGLFAILMAMGRYTPLFPLLYHSFPLMDKFRWPAKMMVLAVFSMVILAGMGAQILLGSPPPPHRPRKEAGTGKRLFLRILLAGDLLIMLSALATALYPETVLVSLISRARPGAIPAEARYRMILQGIGQMVLLFNLSLGVVWLGLRRRPATGRPPSYLAPLCVLVLFVDLFGLNGRINPVADPAPYLAKPKTTEWLQQQPQPYRIATTFLPGVQQALYGLGDPQLFSWAREWLLGETSLPDHLFKAWGSGTLLLADYHAFLLRLYRPAGGEEGAATVRKRVLDLLNVRYLIEGDPLRVIGRWQVEPLPVPPQVQAHPSPLPRALVIRDVEVIPDRQALQARLLDERFDPRRTLLLEEPPSVNGPGKRSDGSSRDDEEEVRRITYTPNTVAIDLKLNGPGFLLLLDTYAPSWKAWVNGREVKVYRADYLFRAVPLTGEEGRIFFSYRPRSVPIGGGVSLLTLTGLLIWQGRTRWLRRQKHHQTGRRP